MMPLFYNFLNIYINGSVAHFADFFVNLHNLLSRLFLSAWIQIFYFFLKSLYFFSFKTLLDFELLKAS